MIISAVEIKTYKIELPNEKNTYDIDVASDMIQQGIVEPKTHKIEFTYNEFPHMPKELAEQILNSVIDYVCDQEQDKTSSIAKLIDMGFSPVSLVNYFGFNLHDVAETIGEDEEDEV